MIKGDIVADFRGFTNHYAQTMINKKPRANLRAGVDFNAR